MKLTIKKNILFVVLASGGITIDDNKNIENCIISLCDLDYEDQ